MLEKRAERRGILGEIFRAMDYNENQVENFSTILTWLATRDYSLTPILNGERVPVSASNAENKFLVGQTPVSVSYSDSKQLKETLTRLESKPATAPAKLDDKEIAARLGKLGSLIEKEKSALCRAEAVGCGVPVGQVEAYDHPNWKTQMSLANESSSAGLGKAVLLELSRQGYSTMGRLLQLLSLLIGTDERVVLVLSGEGPEDASLLLPPAFLVDALNRAKIRAGPIDLLLLDQSSEECLEVLRRAADSGQISILGHLGSITNKLPTSVRQGVLSGESSMEGRGAHYVLDSTADTQTAVDSILADAWCSGTKVNSRTRLILFVHQPAAERIIALFEKGLAGLRTTPDLHLKASDFIKRRLVRLDSAAARAEGVKTIPAESDFSLPTLVYDVGPSSELMSGRSGGLGHVLFVIPYRSPAELLALANNYGDENEVFIFTAQAALAKQIALNIKGTPVYVNQAGGKANEVRPFLDRRNKLGLLVRNETVRATAPLRLNNGDEFGRAVLGGAKALAAWSALSIEDRYTLGARVLRAAIQSDGSLSESDRSGYLSDLLKVAGRLYAERSNEGRESLVSRQYKPFGLSAVLLVNPEKMSRSTTLLPLLVSLLKGNVGIVVSVSMEQRVVDPAVIQACTSILPPGVVHFLHSPTLPQALNHLSLDGKVGLAWILHAGGQAPVTSEIPLSGFGRILVDEASSLPELLASRGAQVEISKTIYL